MVGKVKFAKLSQGYGFIVTEEGDEFFFHHEQFAGDWESLCSMCPPRTGEGPIVFFKAIEHKRGPRAIQVELEP